MSLFIQHGHGKGNKITEALSVGSVDGVVFSARNEKPENLDSCIAELRETGDCEILFDPQFYVSTLLPPNDRYLPEYYPYYQAGRTAADFIGASKLQRYAKLTLDFELDRGLDRLISPTVLVNGFSDRWSQVALTLADATVEYHASLKDPPPLLLSLVLSEGAFDSKDELDGFLDTITTWDVDGFYLIVARDEPTYAQQFDEARLAHLMYLVHVLADRNGFRLVCGYSDFAGILLRAAGAAAFATGWSQSGRQFHVQRFLKRPSGGRPSRLRYSSAPLFNSIMLSELQSISEIGRLNAVVSGVPLDEIITRAPAPEASDWNLSVSEQHHWQTLRRLDGTLSGNPRTDIPALYERLREAFGLYTSLQAVPFERFTGSDHLREWARALRSFRDLVGI